MSVASEFKAFIARGNVLDLAVGVIIGAAFGKIVSSLTEDVIMPLVGLVTGNVDFTNKFVVLGAVPATYKGALTDYAALKAAGVPMLGYGAFTTAVINFLLMANGGGPACLRLRVVADPAAIDPRFLLDEARIALLESVVAAHWPEQIDPTDIGSAALARSVQAARAAVLEAAGLTELA